MITLTVSYDGQRSVLTARTVSEVAGRIRGMRIDAASFNVTEATRTDLQDMARFASTLSECLRDGKLAAQEMLVPEHVLANGS